MLIAGKYNVPDKCPEGCKLRPEYFDQGDICARCPVFNCAPCIIDGEDWSLLDPSEYREDWAKQWEHFFLDGTLPRLKY